MVQIVGLMVGCYILVRMFQFILRKEESFFVKVISGVNIVVTLFLMVDLILGGHKV